MNADPLKAQNSNFEVTAHVLIFFLVLSFAIGIAEALTLLLCEGQDEGRAGLFFLTEDLNVILTSPKVFGGEIRGACKGPRHGLGRKFVRVCTIFAAKGHRLKLELEATLDELNWFSTSISSSSVKPAFIAISMNSGVVGDSIPSSESALEDQNLPNKRSGVDC